MAQNETGSQAERVHHLQNYLYVANCYRVYDYWVCDDGVTVAAAGVVAVVGHVYGEVVLVFAVVAAVAVKYGIVVVLQ